MDNNGREKTLFLISGVFLFSTSEKLETLWKGCKRITKTLLALDHLIEFHQSDSSSFSGRKNFVTQKLTNELFYENLSDNVKKPSTDIVDPEKIVFSKKTGASELGNYEIELLVIPSGQLWLLILF